MSWNSFEKEAKSASEVFQNEFQKETISELENLFGTNEAIPWEKSDKDIEFFIFGLWKLAK